MPVDRDRYGRLVAEVFTVNVDSQAEKSMQTELLTAGLAYVHDRYVEDCPNAFPMREAQRIAQAQNVGVWSGNHQPPWEYRRSR